MSVVSARARAADAAFAVVKKFYFNSRYGERRRRARHLRLHLRQSARNAARRARRRDPRTRRAARQELVRLQDQRSGGPQAFLAEKVEPRARPRLRAGGHRAHRRRLRRHHGGLPTAARRRRRGDLLRAGLVLLRADAARRRRRAAQGRSQGAGASISTSPRSRRRSARGPGWSSSIRRTIRPAASTIATRCRRLPTCSSAPRPASAVASSSCRTSPTAACASMGAASSARRRSIPGR